MKRPRRAYEVAALHYDLKRKVLAASPFEAAIAFAIRVGWDREEGIVDNRKVAVSADGSSRFYRIFRARRGYSQRRGLRVEAWKV